MPHWSAVDEEDQGQVARFRTGYDVTGGLQDLAGSRIRLQDLVEGFRI